MEARKNSDRPKSWLEIISDLFNDDSLVFTTEMFPELHFEFAHAHDLSFSDMPGPITPDEVKSRTGSMRADLIQVVHSWEKSGDGFGMRPLADSAWGRYTDEHRQLTDGDNRCSFLSALGNKKKNCECLLCLWAVSDMHNILSNVLNVLGKDVAVDSNGKIRVGAAATQNKRKIAEDKKEQERSTKAFRAQAGAAMTAFAVAATEETLLNKRTELARLEKEAAETEDRSKTANSGEPASCYCVWDASIKAETTHR